MQHQKPLVEAMHNFVKQRNYSLHVPGHKHGTLSKLPQPIKDSLAYDVTELNGLDDLYHATSILLTSQQLLTELHNTKESFFLVNGSTVGNLIMLLSNCQMGDKIFIQRNAHKSIFNALELGKINPIYIGGQWDQRTQTMVSISLDTIRQAILKYPTVKTILLTTPTYYGECNKELLEIIQYCHAHDIIVLIDEAHGAHFDISPHFPKSSLRYGADMVVQSAHKTLPAMTMGAYLHVNSESISLEKVRQNLSILQSSSPSYLIMASLDDARHYKGNYTLADSHYFMEKRQLFIESLRSIRGLEIIEVEDPLKLLLRAPGYTGFQLQSALEQQHVYVELADLYQVVCVLPLVKVNEETSFIAIRKAIKYAYIQLIQTATVNYELIEHYDEPVVIEPIYSPFEVKKQASEFIHYTQALHRIAAETIIPYPPGIPLFVAGEKITLSMLTNLEMLQLAGANFQRENRNTKEIKVVK